MLNGVDERRGNPVAVACQFGASAEWRPSRLVALGERSVTIEPCANPGEMGRASGRATVRLRYADGTEVEIQGTIRHRSWLEEGVFGLGIEHHGIQVLTAAVA